MEKFRIVKEGYDKEEVDQYIFKLNEEIKKYKKKTTAIEAEAYQQLTSFDRKIKHIRMKLDAFQSQYNQMIHRYLISMNNDDFSNLYSSLDKISKSIHTKRSETNPSLIEMNYEEHANDL